MSMGKILITGATGDTGGYATEQLLQKGHQVRALVHRIDDRSKRLEDKGVEVVAGDYLDLDAMQAAVDWSGIAVTHLRPTLFPEGSHTTPQ
jgi:NAD(P)H dehydrogenase (quinone)